MTVVARKVIVLYYGRAPSFAFFNGCSTGGRQALMEAQRYPDDYNGILAGAPVIDYTHLQAAHFAIACGTRKVPGSYFPPSISGDKQGFPGGLRRNGWRQRRPH